MLALKSRSNFMKKALVIVGMHRSHTSLLARILHQAGLFLGADLIEGDAHNIYGHFESAAIVKFHESWILKEGLGSKWNLIDRRKARLVSQSSDFKKEALGLLKEGFDRDQYGWKDPRAPFFLEGWHAVLPDAKYLMVFRHPVQVVRSLVRRTKARSGKKIHPFLIHRYMNLWNETNKAILAFYTTHTKDCILLNSPEDLLNESTHQILKSRLDDWGFELKNLDFEGLIDHSLLRRSKEPFAIKAIYQMRSETKQIMNDLHQTRSSSLTRH